MSHRPILAALALVCAACLPAAASAATFQGRSVDGPRYRANIENADFGAIQGVEVKFNGDHVLVYLRGNWQVNLILDDEDIADPHHIVGHDHKRGIPWEIDVHNLREAAPPVKKR